MNKERKEIVLKEIKYWKDHRLLPEHYCDFLLSLYTEGSATEQKRFERKSFAQLFSFKRLLTNLFLFYLVLQLPLTYVVIYFTEISVGLQISILFFFIMICSISSIYFYRKKGSFLHVTLVIGVLILFLTSTHVVSSVFMNASLALIIVILTNCAIWIALGYVLKLKYLVISGIAGAVILISYNLL